MVKKQESALHSRQPREGFAVAKACSQTSSLNGALSMLATLGHPPGWDVVAHVRFSAGYEYDHSLGMKTYVAYARDAASSQAGSLVETNEIERCHKAGQAQGWRCVGTYADLGLVDAGEPGPALAKLLHRVLEYDIDYLVVGDLSHLSRDPLSIKQITETLAAAGTELAVAHDQIKVP